MKNIIIKILLLIFGMMMNGYNGFTQEFKCGTIISDKMAKEIIENRKNRTSKMLKPSNTTLSVAIRPHIIRDKLGNGGITIGELNRVIKNLNDNFQQVNMRFVYCEINYIDNNDYFNGISVTQGLEFNNLINEDAANNLLNMYFVPNMTGVIDGNTETVYGFALPNNNFVVINNTAFSGGVAYLPDVPTHEMGHYFGLLHTFQGDDEHPKRTNGGCQNCTTAGDGFCDTGADREKNQNFHACTNNISSEMCESTRYNFSPPCNNFMSYYFKTMNSFSSKQIEFMRNYRQMERGGINGNCGSNPHPNETCSDGNLNQNEIGTDCGGVCPPCHCFDGQPHPDELGTDCGGVCPAICTNGGPFYFSCESGCNNDLALNCGSISAEERNNTIIISNTQIKNNGSTTANDIQIEFALMGSEGEIFLTTAIPGSDIIEEIAPGVTITGPAPVLAYPNELSGTYQLKVKLKNSSNSCISTEQLNINIEEPLPPETSSGDIDLVFNNCGSITENDNGYSIAYDLQNIGSETITATQLGAYLSSDEIVDQDDVLIKEFPIQSLGPDYSIRFSISFNLNNIVLPQGDAYIILKLDNDNIASETNESNNTCVKKLKGQSCDYTITNNTDCEIDLFWSNHNLSEHFEATTIAPFGTLTTSIEDGFRWTSGKIKVLYETAHCASPSYVINASACLSTVCNEEDGYVSHYSLNKNYHAENYIIAPLPGYTNLVKANNNATLKAGEYICLKPGFHARYGSDFLASIEACSNASVPKFAGSSEALTLRNFPNPFSGKTTIEFELPNDSKATLFVTDMMGKKVAILLDNEAQAKGYHTVNFLGSSYSPGMYYYTLQAGDYIETQKMILMK